MPTYSSLFLFWGVSTEREYNTFTMHSFSLFLLKAICIHNLTCTEVLPSLIGSGLAYQSVRFDFEIYRFDSLIIDFRHAKILAYRFSS